MCCGVLGRPHQVSAQAGSVFYFRWGKLEAVVGQLIMVFAPVSDPYLEGLTLEPSSILVVPIASFDVPARTLHQSSFVLQTFIVASRLSSLALKISMTAMATNHQH
jgi:hypothetical protein